MRNVLLIAAALACSNLAAQAAQDYPYKPIRLVVPYPPGGANDNLARPFVQMLGERLGVVVILDNRGGAGAMIGTELVAKAPPDGYTILFCSTATHATSPQLFKRVAYDPFKDFEPVTLLATTPVLAASNNINGITSIKGLVDAAKASPGKFTYGSGGVGSVSHLSAEIFKALANINLLHVPYKGGGDFQGDMIAGRIDIQINSAPTVSPHVKSGRMTALALARPARWPDLPNVQTFAEAGWPQYRAGGWYGLCAPAKTPKAVIDRLQREAVAVVTSADYRARLTALVADPAGSTPKEFAAHLRSEYERYGKVIKATGARTE
ncbi:MAG: hypothetical protein A3F74_10550 [Betaproteobacteria bacterium RIFCSPLOWO2_12_FULL_62_58]|nr:MAG: hypothetical protein A3F74_10550 [Betaproteobacteria bacterium RIFCSPLOWO2_12_FULL_62_58]